MRALLSWALRQAGRRPARAALALAGVVLGVAAMAAISVATGAARTAYRDMYGAIAGRAALEVVAEGQGRIEEAVLDRIRTTPGVKTAAPVASGPAALVSPGPRVPALLLGVDPALDARVRDVEVVEGRGLGQSDGAVVLEGFARSQGIRLGGRVGLLTRAGPREIEVVGLARSAPLSAVPGAVVLLRLGSASEALALGGRPNAVQLVIDEERTAEVEAALASSLPAGLRVQRPAARALLADASLRSSERGLEAVSLVALVAAAFVVMNAVGMNLAERRRDLATTRALGATRGQVAAALLAEAAVLGALGTVLGVALGIAGARWVADGIGRMLSMPLPTPRATWGAVASALALGPAATIAAVVAPTRRAARRDPLRDLLGAPEDAAAAAHPVAGWAGLALVLATLATSAGLARGLVPPSATAAYVAAGMLGLALLFPAVLPWVGRGCVAVLAPLVGPAGRLGLAQFARRPVHTALSANVLFLAVTAAVGVGGELLSAVDDVRDWARRALTEDFFVRATMPESGTLSAASLPESLGEEIRALPDVDHANQIRFVQGRAGGVAVLVIAHTFPAGRPMDLPLRAWEGGSPPNSIGSGEAVLGTSLAHDLGLAPGAEIPLSTRSGPRSLRVIATTTEYTAGGHALYVSWETATEAFGPGGADAFMVVARPGRRAALAAALASLCARSGLLLQSNADLHATVDGMVDGVTGLLWTCLAVVFLVASLGVLNTLTTNVLEQERSIGVLRAVGTTRGQVRRMVGAQAVAMAASAVVPGVPAGIGLARVINEATVAVRGFTIPFHVDVTLVLACAAAAAGVAVLAALLPAWRAARLPVTSALRAE